MRKPILVLAILALAAVAIGQSKSGDPKRFVRTFPPSDQEQTAAGGSGPLPNEVLPFDAGVVSYWTLASDGTDSVGPYDLTNNNGVTFVAKGGGAPANMPATVAHFVAASSQNFSVTAGAWPDTSSDSSASLWIKSAAGAIAAGAAISVYAGSARDTLLLFENVGDLVLYTDPATPPAFVDIQTAINTSWHHIVLTYTVADSTWRIYYDGVLDAQKTVVVVGAWDSLDMHIGSGTFGYAMWDGDISSVVIWGGRVLTPADVTYLYNGGAGRF